MKVLNRRTEEKITKYTSFVTKDGLKIDNRIKERKTFLLGEEEEAKEIAFIRRSYYYEVYKKNNRTGDLKFYCWGVPK